MSKGRFAEDWTDEKKEKLRTLWMQSNPRLSTLRLGEIFHVSKHSIIGVAHRMNLPPRDNPVKRRDGVPAKRPHANRGRPKAEVIKIMPADAPVLPTFSRVPCQWPIGMPKQPGFHFCGGKALYGKPYCEEHCKRAYRQPGDQEAVDSP